MAYRHPVVPGPPRFAGADDWWGAATRDRAAAIAASRSAARLWTVGFHLGYGNIRLHQQTSGIGQNADRLARPQALVPFPRFVPAVGIGKRFRPPCQPRQTLADRLNQHVLIAEPWQIQILGDIFGKLLDPDMIAAPSGTRSSSWRRRRSPSSIMSNSSFFNFLQARVARWSAP